MLVFTNDVKKLIHDSITKFQEDSGQSFGDPSIQEFFKNMIQKINSEYQVKLNNDTFYKQYYIRIKSHTSSEIGYSVNYLNALCQYAYQQDFLDEFSRVIEDENEVPEFPFDHPCFPATPAVKIQNLEYKNLVFTNLWIKDESFNPTGTHKDRKAHELYLNYSKRIRDIASNEERIVLPLASIISSGYAALALQYRLRKAGLPNLKVLIDKETPKVIKKWLSNSRAEIYETDLTNAKLSPAQIKKLTNNVQGIELTYEFDIADSSYTYYDWLSYECLNLNPNMLIVPYGSGELFRNILEVHSKEVKSQNNSKRYFGNKDILKDCNFIGVRPKMNKKESDYYCLVSYFDTEDQNEINGLYKFCGNSSGPVYVKENKKRLGRALTVCRDWKIKTEASGIAGLVYLFQMIDEGVHVNPNQKIVIINTGTIKGYLFDSPL